MANRLVSGYHQHVLIASLLFVHTDCVCSLVRVTSTEHAVARKIIRHAGMNSKGDELVAKYRVLSLGLLAEFDEQIVQLLMW